MTMRPVLAPVILLGVLAPDIAVAQAATEVPHDTNILSAALRVEGGSIAERCKVRLAVLWRCPMELLTANPLHVAVGSLPPKNGFAFGPAFAFTIPQVDYTQSLNADAVFAPSGSWRAGLYYKFRITNVNTPVVVPIGSEVSPAEMGGANLVTLRPYPVIDAYVQSTSLKRILFFGLGPDTRPEDRTVFGLTETIVGGRATYPLPAAPSLDLAVVGEVNGRFVDIGDPDDTSIPSTADRFDDVTAPGLTTQAGAMEVGGGISMRPLLWNRVQFDYSAMLAQHVAPGRGSQSFRRWRVELNHELRLTSKVLVPATSNTRGPDDCADSTTGRCPELPFNRTNPSFVENQYGTLSFNAYASQSSAGRGNVVPFYFQETLGGSTLDGVRRLSAYEDYRFRAPTLVVLRESFEHYIYAFIGFSGMLEQGVVSNRGVSPLPRFRSSRAAGISLRFGGLPMAHLQWAWGDEGRRFVAVVDTSLLGGGSRPRLQ